MRRRQCSSGSKTLGEGAWMKIFLKGISHHDCMNTIFSLLSLQMKTFGINTFSLFRRLLLELISLDMLHSFLNIHENVKQSFNRNE